MSNLPPNNISLINSSTPIFPNNLLYRSGIQLSDRTILSPAFSFPVRLVRCRIWTNSTSFIRNRRVEPMDSDTSLRRRKIIHLVRHAQGIHNLENSAKSKTSPELFDAKLSPLGWKQIDRLRENVVSIGLLNRIQLVVVSPLLRTMETAVGVFGGKSEIPFIAVEMCRERLGVNTCDKRRNVSEYKTLFPTIEFSLIESEEDTWWTPDVRESDDDVAARGIKFFNWIWSREEEEIAVVTHSAFLFQTLNKFGDDCQESMTIRMRKFFQNCELRSMELADGKVKKGSNLNQTMRLL